jgi:hypothetical protein
VSGKTKNFRINRAQAWTLCNILNYSEAGAAAPVSAGGECVINPESYDPKHESFKFAIQLKDEAPDSVWNSLEYPPNADGWLFFGMYKDGKTKQLEAP